MAVPSSVTTTFPASITTSGEGNGVLIALDRVSPNDQIFITASGTYATATIVIEARLRNMTAFVPIAAFNSTSSALVGSGGSIALTDNASNQFSFGAGPYDQICVYASALASGTISVGYGSGPIGSVPPLVSATVSNTAIASATTITSTSANALAVGANGTTNPVFNVNAATSSVATGITVVGAAAAGGIAITATSSGTDETLVINGKGAGGITLNNTATGTITAGSSLTFADAKNVILNATTGTKFGTATTQKLAFYNSTPIVQPANTVDYLANLVNLGLRASGGTAAAAFPGLISSSSPTGGIGYATGAGGAQTQSTDKTTTVVSNTITTAITCNNANLAAATVVSFTFTNSSIAATDTVLVTHQSAGTSGAYTFNAFPGAGSAVISIRNNTAGGLAEAIVLRVTVIKSVSA